MTSGDGARGRNDAIPANQAQDGFQPAGLTDANPPRPAGYVSNLSSSVPSSGIELPTFTTRADLEAWAQWQLETFQRDAPYARNQVRLMLSVADRIRRVTLAHQHLGDE